MDSFQISFNEVMERVAMVVESKEGSKPYDKNIASALGISPSNYANIKKRGRIPYAEISKFCHINGITINWVLYGGNSKRLVENEEKIYKIRLLENMNVSAGGGAYCEEEPEENYLYIDKASAERIGITNIDNIEAVRVVGDSMQPTLSENSTILVDRTKIELGSGGIYVVNTSSGVFVKRLAVNPKGGIDLISDNKAYGTVTVPFEEIVIVGKVVGTVGRV